MKITIVDIAAEEEEEIIIKCHRMDEDLMQLLRGLKQGSDTLNVYQDGKIYRIKTADVYYFESVDQKVFAYCRQEVYEIKSRLYELEGMLSPRDFLRATKSTILNLNHIRQLSPAFNGRFEALLKNGEKMIISRQYVADLKKKLGL